MQFLRFLVLAFGSVFSLVTVASNALPEEDEWVISIGLGGIQTPSYLGDDQSQIRFLPDTRFRKGDRFDASVNRGVRYDAFINGPWRFGPVLKYNFGRDEDAGDDNDLVGYGDVDGTFELGFKLDYEITDSLETEFEIRRGFDGGHSGLLGQLALSYSDRFTGLGPPAFYSVGPQINFGDQQYLSAFFDVDESQSLETGISEYDVGGGIYSLSLNANAIMPIAPQLFLFGFAVYGSLLNDVGESSIVEEVGSSEQFAFGLSINYAL